MDTTWVLVIAFGLGWLHSFDVDHLCAVASFAAHARRARDAAWLGVRWAIGHTAALVVFGGLVAMLKVVVPEWFNQVAELAVGAALVAVGIWLIRETYRARHVHVHWHEHDGRRHFHMHSHARSRLHHHKHRLTLLGVLHGLAGTSGVMVLIPVSLAKDLSGALLYIAVFGAGTVLSMALFAAGAGRVFVWVGRWQTATRYLRGALGAVSCGVGMLWIGHNVQHLLW